ncbi:hypothetical protein GCM10023205_43160 [Yinghuangia aomiensis]|uniref:Acyl-CoA synthetase (AMP-forming)/AMP-acid ligase II n=1 Tax=Yinghuangia aomiensis TaxID=676205 RepID=A0ABP9HJV2_9ACTN
MSVDSSQLRLTALLDPRPGDTGTVAIHSEAREVTRAELRVGALALADRLRAVGVRPGQAVAVMSADGADTVAALFGVWFAEAVYVPLNPRLTDRELAHVLGEVRPAAIVAGGAGTERFPGRQVIEACGRGGSYAWSARAADSTRSPDTAAPPHSAHTPDTALIQFTSGTTGPPKPVLLRHSGISALLEPVLAKLVGAGRKPRADPMPNLIPTSLSLWAGIYNVLFAFRVGAPVVLMERFDTRRFAGYVRRFKIRSVVLPPAAMVMLTDDAAVADLAPLAYIRSITAPLSPFQARRFRDRFGITVLNCYGQTEIGGEIVGWNAADARAHGEAKLGAVGRPHDGVALAIRDDDGTDLPRGASGELWVRTPAIADGYANGSGLADRLDPDGWFRTGDIGRVDAEGFLWIDGRASDMINRGGLKVFPAEVAEVLGAAPGVAEAAVVGVPDPRLGEVPWAVVVPRTPGGIDAVVLDAWCREHLAPFKVPVRYATVEALPRTEAGKVRTAELAALARDAPDAPTPGGTAP